MAPISIEEAQAHLEDLIARLGPGEEVRIVEGDKTVARLVRGPAGGKKPRRPGSAIGQFFVCEDDDEHLRDFEAYMP